MEKNITKEKTIKRALKVKSFKNLPVEKYDDLAKLLVNTRKDIAISIINQLPEYTTYAKEMLAQLTAICQSTINAGNTAHNDTIQAYNLVLNALNNELQTKRLTKRRKKKITTKMLDIADKIAQEGTEHKKFVLQALKTFGQIGIAIGALAVAVVAIAKDQIKK